MAFVLCLLVFAPAEAGWFSDHLERAAVTAMGFDAGDSCGFTRDDALRCLTKHVDVNHDGVIDAAEFERAKQRYMPQRAKAVMWAARKLGYDVTLKQVLEGCDANKDGRFTREDWMASAKTCLPFPADLCKLKTACDIAEKVDNFE
jgi:hypothetical protein